VSSPHPDAVGGAAFLFPPGPASSAGKTPEPHLPEHTHVSLTLPDSPGHAVRIRIGIPPRNQDHIQQLKDTDQGADHMPDQGRNLPWI
jgi:hypothetical protein